MRWAASTRRTSHTMTVRSPSSPLPLGSECSFHSSLSPSGDAGSPLLFDLECHCTSPFRTYLLLLALKSECCTKSKHIFTCPSNPKEGSQCLLHVSLPLRLPPTKCEVSLEWIRPQVWLPRFNRGHWSHAGLDQHSPCRHLFPSRLCFLNSCSCIC